MKSNELIKINTVGEATKLFGLPPANHPLIGIFHLSDAKSFTASEKSITTLSKSVQLNLYSILMKDGSQCTSVYGWREYDFKRGLMSFFAPGQVHSWSGDYESPDISDVSGWVLAFHPDFIRKYALGVKIGKLKFFSYETNEALHMSDAEQTVIEGIMQNIYDESNRSIDAHCQDIIVSQLDVLLNYAERFYTRQFRTRNSVETDILTRFQTILHKHFDSDKEKFVTPNEIATELAMSVNYLSDLLRNLTGQNTQQHIHAYLIERAKNLLLTTNLSVNEIAYLLGFEYPQYFSRLFKNKTKQTPLQFRKAS
ncbi:MAG: AraC family transcriptional regulator [Bacteroidales bacterium]|nr:AraC family transcriptional regulator [Bacteroidales bacterium]